MTDMRSLRNKLEHLESHDVSIMSVSQRRKGMSAVSASKTNGRGGKNNDTTSEIRVQLKFLPLSFVRNRIARRKKMKSWAIKIVDWIVNLRFHQSFSRLAKKNLWPRSAWTADTKKTQQSWEIARAAHWQQKTAMPAHTTSPIEFGAMCCTLVFVVVLFAVCCCTSHTARVR